MFSFNKSKHNCCNGIINVSIPILSFCNKLTILYIRLKIADNYFGNSCNNWFQFIAEHICPTSLDLDVEMYADYFLKKGEAFLKMDQKSFNECLSYVLCGIVKNKIQYYYAKHPSCDIRRIIKPPNK